MEALTWLNKQFGTTIVFVSHDTDDQKYAGRVVTPMMVNSQKQWRTKQMRSFQVALFLAGRTI